MKFLLLTKKETKSIKINVLAEFISQSEESVRHFLNRLANKNLIDYKV